MNRMHRQLWILDRKRQTIGAKGMSKCGRWATIEARGTVPAPAGCRSFDFRTALRGEFFVHFLLANALYKIILHICRSNENKSQFFGSYATGTHPRTGRGPPI
jgi:hypothetical protein